MTRIEQPNFSMELPGEWEPAPSAEPNVFVYRETGGSDRIAVTLLGVKPLFAIADKHRLLDDYLHHRSNYEKGADPEQMQSQPISRDVNGTFEGSWSAFNAETGRRVRHHVLLVDNLLADFSYQGAGMDDSAFAEKSDAVFATVTATAG